VGYNSVFLRCSIVHSIIEKNANYIRLHKKKSYWWVYMYSMLSIVGDVSTHQTFSEIAGKIALQNVLFRSYLTKLHSTLLCITLPKISHFLHLFSIFNTLFWYFGREKVIFIQNKCDILNQHQKLYRLAHISMKFVFGRN